MEIHIDNKIIENATEEEKETLKDKLNPQKQEDTTQKPSILNYDINQLIKEISEKIVGQQEAIKTLVSNIYYNQLLIEKLSQDYYIDLAELDSRKVSILLDGPTGTGKTAILKEISSKLDIPIVFCNANSFSETGYVGPSITDTLRKLYKLSNKRLSEAQRGIIVFDEIDKIASNVRSEKDMKKGVQEELLGFISGGIYDFPLEENNYASEVIHFDTTKLTFILSGAFTNLRERKTTIQKKNTNQIGFISVFEQDKSEDEVQEYTITPQDYVDEGLHREFFGRIKVLTCTRGYEYADLLNILANSSVSPIKNFMKTAEMFGYDDVSFSFEFIDLLCKKALDMNTGARALQTIMSGIQNRLLLGMINHEYDSDKTLEITPKILDEYEKSLIRRK